MDSLTYWPSENLHTRVIDMIAFPRWAPSSEGFIPRLPSPRLVLCTAALSVAACAAPAVDHDEAAFEAMGAVYDRFTRAYRLGEPDSVVVLYGDSPLYLPGRGPIVEGREALRTQFEFLDNAREQGATPHIWFESVGRGTSGELAWDVGYYTIQVENRDGSRSPPNRGKFTTVWRRDSDGQWRIMVDGFSPAGN